MMKASKFAAVLTLPFLLGSTPLAQATNADEQQFCSIIDQDQTITGVKAAMYYLVEVQGYAPKAAAQIGYAALTTLCPQYLPLVSGTTTSPPVVMAGL